ncbi:hypothetical protein [Streptomyces sp. NPDC006925]|uniref:hypothetical protein n=1 Tax=Streptomyces sp. NPDC006925 TaxID=3364768 RepID=UPI0036AE768E
MVGLPLLGLGWLWVRVGWWAVLLAGAALAYAVWGEVRRRRALRVHRQRQAACFSMADIDAADDRRFRTIVGRLLLRDGWTQVRGVRIRGPVVHLVGVGPDGRQLGIAFEHGAAQTGQESGGRGVLRPVGTVQVPPEHAARPLFLVVSSGLFGRERVLWAARHGIRLVDRPLLQRWAAGEALADVLDIGEEDVRTRATAS